MPTRILYWNISNFSLPKIYATGSPPEVAEAADRSTLIVNEIVAGGPAPPQIFVVVEVYSRTDEVSLEGTVISQAGNAGAGALLLLNRLRRTLGDTWCLVPPLRLGEGGQQEAVLVFFDAAVLQFQGPNLFFNRFPDTVTPIGQGQPVAAETFNQIIDYPPEWKNCLPWPNNPIAQLRLAARTTDFPGAININEYQLAGQWEYYIPPRCIPSPIQPPYPTNRIFFPNVGCRAPFWTQFRELAMGGRTLNLFAVHTSPGSARQAVINMQQVAEMASSPQPNTVNVIFGDFNVDSYSCSADAYTWMVNGQYTMQLDPRVNHAGPLVDARKPYLMTHLLPTAQGWPFNAAGGPADPQHNVYPRYGYMGSAFPQINDSGAIDNFFTAYGAPAAAPVRNNITVVNPVIGTPYNAIPAPTGVTAELTGGLAYPQVLADHIPPGGVNPPVDTINFQAWKNFGRIYSVSDHLPLILDV